VLTDARFAVPLGGLLLSAVATDSPMLVLRAVHWWRELGRLGIDVPFFVAHDFGLLLSVPRDQIQIGPRPAADDHVGRVPGLAALAKAYRSLVEEVAGGDMSKSAEALRLSDDLVVVALARVLAALGRKTERSVSSPWMLPLDPELVRDLGRALPRLFASVSRESDAAFLRALVHARLRVLTLVDSLDVDTLRLLGILGTDTTAIGALGYVDLLAALGSPMASDIVNFSLELLPGVFETTRARAAGTHPAHGYGGIGINGTADSMVLSELAWDSEEFARRMLDGELLYFTRDRAPDEARRLHCILIDASASMRGDREVFARGLAIALGKKLQLAGEEVWLRFFDSRLYDAQRPRGRGHLPAAWLLGFKGERGRNPARVFAQLATELSLVRARDARDPVVHIITHAALHVPRPLVHDVQRQARLFGVFILPSGGALDLEWLDLMAGYATVDHTTLQHRGSRAEAATRIVDGMAPRPPR